MTVDRAGASVLSACEWIYGNRDLAGVVKLLAQAGCDGVELSAFRSVGIARGFPTCSLALAYARPD